MGNNQDRVCDMRKRLSDILMTISWREFANTYFGRSSSWLYHKMDGIDGNGAQGGFTKEEAQQMHGALCDLADRIRRAADNIPIGNDTAHRHRTGGYGTAAALSEERG